MRNKSLNVCDVIYQFLCHCDSRYVCNIRFKGCKTEIHQHIFKSIRFGSSFQKHTDILPASQCKFSTVPNTQSLASDSAIGLHPLQNLTVFNILMIVDSLILLKIVIALPSTYPLLNLFLLKPLSFAGKEFVYSLKVCHALTGLSFCQSRFDFYFKSSTHHSNDSSC